MWLRFVISFLNHSQKVRRFPSDDAGSTEVGFGSGISTDGIIGGPGEECDSAVDERGGALDSREFSRDAGGGSSKRIVNTR